MTTVHLIYPHGSRISCPDAIGRNVALRLQERYQVIAYDWDDIRKIIPGENDVLVGHAHPVPWTTFRRSMHHPGWKRVISISPYSHGDNVQVAFLDSVIPYCDLYLAITGEYWYHSVAQSSFSHWLPKMVHLDLAVDRGDFPIVKREFNPPGKRRIVYIGHSAWTKNTGYLTEIARAMPPTNFGWIGAGDDPIEGFETLGVRDFTTQSARELVAGYDFLITVSKSDANPTTILEAMAWGLIPICTPQSGYSIYPTIPNVPLDDARRAAEILTTLQNLPDRTLRAMQAANWTMLDTHFNWDRFTEQIIDAIESKECPPLAHETLLRRSRLRWTAFRSPYAWRRPRNFLRALRSAIRRHNVTRFALSTTQG